MGKRPNATSTPTGSTKTDSKPNSGKEFSWMFYNIITERIIEKLEAGTIPWHKPWRSIGAPRNLVSKKLYRGVNVWLLTVQGYTSPYWATMRQINELGGQ